MAGCSRRAGRGRSSTIRACAAHTWATRSAGMSLTMCPRSAPKIAAGEVVMKRLFAILAAIVLILPFRLDAAVTPEAKAVLTKVGEAYSKLKSLDLAGKLTGDLDIDGQTDHP